VRFPAKSAGDSGGTRDHNAEILARKKQCVAVGEVAAEDCVNVHGGVEIVIGASERHHALGWVGAVKRAQRRIKDRTLRCCCHWHPHPAGKSSESLSWDCPPHFPGHRFHSCRRCYSFQVKDGNVAYALQSLRPSLLVRAPAPAPAPAAAAAAEVGMRDGVRGREEGCCSIGLMGGDSSM
jgi:hypothetical protein